MTFIEIMDLIERPVSPTSYKAVCQMINDGIFRMETVSLIALLSDIGSIPESIKHTSTKEKLFSKTAEFVLAKCFQEFGLRAHVNSKNTDCADVIAKSDIHNYTLVADAKTFRLSRSTVRARATSWVDGTSLGGHSAGVPVPVDGGPHTGHGRLRYAGTHEKHSGYLAE